MDKVDMLRTSIQVWHLRLLELDNITVYCSEYHLRQILELCTTSNRNMDSEWSVVMSTTALVMYLIFFIFQPLQ